LQSDLEEKIDLIYIDPPFFSGTDYTLKKKGKKEEERAPTLGESLAYSDKWSGGIDEYLSFMEERLEAMYPLLKRSGCIWVHLDWHVTHYVKTILDGLFGYSNFVNEIIWRRTNSPKAQSKGFGSQHDTLLLYAKDIEEFDVKPVYRKHDEKSMRPYRYGDERGKFRLIEIEAQGIQRTADRKQFEWRGRTAPYLYRKQTLDKWWDQGIIYKSKNNRYSKKQYLADTPGVLVSDLWMDISPIQGASKEYLGFLTQKPLALLKRIIESTTKPDELVADFFAGSGTTAVAANNAGRKWILCDNSDVSIEVCRKRLEREVEEDYQFLSL
jgi:DNA modification methylase